MNFDQIADEVELSNERAADRAPSVPDEPVVQEQCGWCGLFRPVPMSHGGLCSEKCDRAYAQDMEDQRWRDEIQNDQYEIERMRT